MGWAWFGSKRTSKQAGFGFFKVKPALGSGRFGCPNVNCIRTSKPSYSSGCETLNILTKVITKLTKGRRFWEF